jgi:hypothetical protein
MVGAKTPSVLYKMPGDLEADGMVASGFKPALVLVSRGVGMSLICDTKIRQAHMREAASDKSQASPTGE